MRKFLLKYTNLAVLFDMLLEKRIFLLNPKTWEDQNDSYYLEIYKGRSGYKSILASCFAETYETFHHWKVFSGNISGVCIEFDKEKLLKHFKGMDGIYIGKVKYKKITELRKKLPKKRQLPFLKRYPYRDEKELRIIYRDRLTDLDSKEFPIDLSCINKILLSPLLPDTLRDSIKKVIRAIPNCLTIRINRSTLINNKDWKSFAKRVS